MSDEFISLSPEEQLRRYRSVAQVALKRWAFPDNTDISPLHIRENAVFKLETPENRYALRIHRSGYQTSNQIRSEQLWMDALRDFGVATAELLPAADGKTIQRIETDLVGGSRDCDLLSWIDGVPLGEETKGSSASYHLLGEVNARLHLQSISWVRPEGFERLVWDEEGLLGDNPLWGRFQDLEILSEENRSLLMQARNKARDRIAKFGKSPERFGLIHADFMPENILMSHGNPYVIDFGDSGSGWF